MPVEFDEFIERRIVTGLLVSTEYINEINRFWNNSILESSAAKMIASWCFDYFDQYKKAPGREIESIFINEAKQNLSDPQAKDVENILSSLSLDYENTEFNLDYLIDQTKQYLNQQNLKEHIEKINDHVEAGELVEAEQTAFNYQTAVVEQVNAINPFESATRIRKAFEYQSEPLIKFPKALGQFWNDQLTRDSFVALLGPEKRGKTFLLMELAIRALMNRKNVVFFQAGDMSEDQQIRRLCIYLAKKSDREKYCKGRYVPVVDCWHNQTDTCNREERECGFGIFQDGMTQDTITKEMLIEAYEKEPDYTACRNCPKQKGAVWLNWQDEKSVLTWKEAYKISRKWQKKHNANFKLSTYPNESLTVTEIYSLLDIWEKQEGFVPDVIIIDYADIMAPDGDNTRAEERHRQNKLWQRLRKLSQEKHCLVITATQAAASSYEQHTLKLSDFSEDKRKYAHVTAMYGLNQIIEEKKIGIMRLNKLVVREEEYSTADQVKILQSLQDGRPFIGSYF